MDVVSLLYPNKHFSDTLRGEKTESKLSLPTARKYLNGTMLHTPCIKVILI